MQIESRRYAVSGGLSLAADVGGNPSHPTVVLLHGGGQTRHSWAGAMRELLTHRYHVVNLDTRGHGDSDWANDGDYQLATLAADLGASTRRVWQDAAAQAAANPGQGEREMAGGPRASCDTEGTLP